MKLEILSLEQPIYFIAGHVFSTPPRVEVWNMGNKKIIALMRNIFDKNPIHLSESEFLKIKKLHPEIVEDFYDY